MYITEAIDVLLLHRDSSSDTSETLMVKRIKPYYNLGTVVPI